MKGVPSNPNPRSARKGPERAEIRPPLPSACARTLLSAFILFHLVAITLWAIPVDTALTQAFRGAVRPYMLWSGLFQAWDMFAPEPLKVNSYVQAVILFRDGTTRIWAFPRMENLTLVERYSKERYRKFTSDNLPQNKYAPIWPDCARYIARLNYNPANPPVSVGLYRAISEIPPPRADGWYQPQPWHGSFFFQYPVRLSDLQ